MKRMILALLMLLSAQTVYAADLSVEGAWVRLVPPVAENSAAYMVVRNSGKTAVKLTGVSSDVSASADLHGMRMQDGRMVMFPLSEVEVPAGGTLAFAPGGMHVMLMGLKHPLQAGDSVEIEFRLSDGGSLKVSAPVRDMRMGHQHHGGMN